MKKIAAPLLIVGSAFSSLGYAADYTDGDIHKNDYKFLQFNLMYAFSEKPGNSDHDYMEMEFGGRSGIFGLYGYVDVFNLTSDKNSDKADSNSKIFMRFAPSVSLDALLKRDLSFGPVEELFIAGDVSWDGANSPTSVNTQLIGLGSTVNVPWMGKMGVNLYKIYDSNIKDWDGYQVSATWFKPFYFFSNGSFLSYQGYIDYSWGHDDSFSQLKTSTGGDMFNGLYWHTDRYAVGYGLKLFRDVYALRDGGLAGETTGVGHYISANYKF